MPYIVYCIIKETKSKDGNKDFVKKKNAPHKITEAFLYKYLFCNYYRA